VRGAIGWKGQKLQFLDRREDLPTELPRIALFWGSRDQIIPVAHAAALVARMEHVTLTQFEGSGHWPQLEQPEEFALALAAFLGDPASARARLRDEPAFPAVPRWKSFLRALWRFIRKRLAALFAAHARKRLPPD
jgi:hypothetical protein